MQTLDAWYAFKSHTVYLQDLDMRKLLTLIEATTDPFAVAIRYHRSCWTKYISSSRQDDSKLHLQHVQISEVRKMFFKYVRMVVLEQHELRRLQSLLQYYIHLLSNFGLNSSVVKSDTIYL